MNLLWPYIVDKTNLTLQFQIVNYCNFIGKLGLKMGTWRKDHPKIEDYYNEKMKINIESECFGQY